MYEDALALADEVEKTRREILETGLLKVEWSVNECGSFNYHPSDEIDVVDLEQAAANKADHYAFDFFIECVTCRACGEEVEDLSHNCLEPPKKKKEENLAQQSLF